jgi:aminoglycoside/choline kinase family phosphotransferase
MRIATKFGVAIDRLMVDLAAAPRTLCHGDFRTDNLMFRLTPAGPKLTAIDWQIVMQARGPYDVGYLMSGAVDIEMRRANEDRLLRRYHDGLVSRGVTGYDFETCREDYRRAILVGLNYWVQGFAVSDQSIPRAVALFDSWAERLDAAVKDLGLEALVE